MRQGGREGGKDGTTSKEEEEAYERRGEKLIVRETGRERSTEEEN